MGRQSESLALLDKILEATIQSWYDRVKSNYVTSDESRQLGVEPEIKIFHDEGSHRLKFARAGDLDVTYGLSALLKDGLLIVESSVNNKSERFDYHSFVEKLKTYYWRSRVEKPWIDSEFDRFTYGDLMPFEPILGQSVKLETQKKKADIVRLRFPINPRHEERLIRNQEILRDLVENYCLHPLKRIYAESYRGN